MDENKPKTKEQALRKCEKPAGTWLLLGDGQKWCIPGIPLGKACADILGKLETLYSLKDKVLPNEATTKEHMEHTRALFNASADFAFSLLQVNYPQLDRQYFDDANLVTIQHSAIIQSISQGNPLLSDILSGDADQGEAKTAAR